jgi:hypothetical protein
LTQTKEKNMKSKRTHIFGFAASRTELDVIVDINKRVEWVEKNSRMIALNGFWKKESIAKKIPTSWVGEVNVEFCSKNSISAPWHDHVELGYTAIVNVREAHE